MNTKINNSYIIQLQVSIDFLDDPPWRVERVQSAQWREVQISLESFQEVVTIEGKAGSTPATRSFIALDDFAFNLGVCSNPSKCVFFHYFLCDPNIMTQII